jgi:hypothetical protein
MALHEHLAILLHSSLDEARPNQKKRDPKTGQPVIERFAVMAFPPEAGNDLATLVRSVSPGGDMSKLGHNPVGLNFKRDKPFPGIPDNYLILRAKTQYEPTIMARNGQQLNGAQHKELIRSSFYPGRRVRAELFPKHWTNDGGGVSFYLTGIMDAGDGERLNIGTESQASQNFAQYADASAPDQTGKASNGQDNPFGNATGGTAGNSAASPAAASSAPAGGDNPFQQAGAGAGNPFG